MRKLPSSHSRRIPEPGFVGCRRILSNGATKRVTRATPSHPRPARASCRFDVARTTAIACAFEEVSTEIFVASDVTCRLLPLLGERRRRCARRQPTADCRTRSRRPARSSDGHVALAVSALVDRPFLAASKGEVSTRLDRVTGWTTRCRRPARRPALQQPRHRRPFAPLDHSLAQPCPAATRRDTPWMRT